MQFWPKMVRPATINENRSSNVIVQRSFPLDFFILIGMNNDLIALQTWMVKFWVRLNNGCFLTRVHDIFRNIIYQISGLSEHQKVDEAAPKIHDTGSKNPFQARLVKSKMCERSGT